MPLPDTKPARRSPEEVRAAAWGALESWLNDLTAPKSVRLEILGHRSALHLGSGVSGLVRLGTLESFRPGLVGAESRLIDRRGRRAQGLIEDRSRADDYQQATGSVGLIIQGLLDAEHALRPASSNILMERLQTNYEVEILVGEGIADIARKRRNPLVSLTK